MNSELLRRVPLPQSLLPTFQLLNSRADVLRTGNENQKGKRNGTRFGVEVENIPSGMAEVKDLPSYASGVSCVIGARG